WIAKLRNTIARILFPMILFVFPINFRIAQILKSWDSLLLFWRGGNARPLSISATNLSSAWMAIRMILSETIKNKIFVHYWALSIGHSTTRICYILLHFFVNTIETLVPWRMRF